MQERSQEWGFFRLPSALLSGHILFYFFFPDKKILSVSAPGTHHLLLLVILLGRGLLGPNWNVSGAATAATHPPLLVTPGTALPLSSHWGHHAQNAFWQWAPTTQRDQVERCKGEMICSEGKINLSTGNFPLLGLNLQKWETWNFRQPTFYWQQCALVTWSWYNVV